MDVSDVAVTGIAGLLGQRLLPRLDASPTVGRVVGLDVRDPERRIGRLEMHRVDIATADLEPLLEGVSVIVHLASIVDPLPDDSFETRVNVDGTRRVLEAATDLGITKVVRVSTAAVYGAWPGNPVPLTEDAPLRPNPGFGPAVQGAEVERMLAAWRADVPGAVTTTLRAAPVLGRGAAAPLGPAPLGSAGDQRPGGGTAGADGPRRRRRRRAAARGRARPARRVQRRGRRLARRRGRDGAASPTGRRGAGRAARRARCGGSGRRAWATCPPRRCRTSPIRGCSRTTASAPRDGCRSTPTRRR